jgi:hypothetical protein
VHLCLCPDPTVRSKVFASAPFDAMQIATPQIERHFVESFHIFLLTIIRQRHAPLFYFAASSAIAAIEVANLILVSPS